MVSDATTVSDAANDETDRYFVARTLADVRGRAFEILYILFIAPDWNVAAESHFVIAK